MTAQRTTALALTSLLVLAGCGDKKPDPVTPAPSTAPTPATTTLAMGEVALDSPADESKVQECGIFQGRANLPPDKTIIIGVRNTSNGNPERYFETVKNWEYPVDLDTWQGRQWFGSEDSSAGQSYRVEVLVVDLELARQKAKAAKKVGWHSPDNPTGATVAAHIDLDRVKGKGPAGCA